MLRLTPLAIHYTLNQLTRIVGLAASVILQEGDLKLFPDLTFTYSSDLSTATEKPTIIVVPCKESRWLSLLSLPKNSLTLVSMDNALPRNYVSSFICGNFVPVLFWGEGYEDGNKPFAERRDDNTIVFYADIIAATFFMLTRWEETVSPVRDQHGRFPATASVAYKQGFLDRPIVDEYALILGAWLKTLLPGWEPRPPRFSVKLSHDIDSIRSALIRTFCGDILKRHSPVKALQTAGQLISRESDPFLQGCYELAGLSETHGFQSAFYFMSAERSSLDSGYDPQEKSIQRLIHNLRKRGHEVGFHPGYETFDNPERFYWEKQRMDLALGESRYGGRQHFLRFRVPHTWRLWENAGLTYDSSLGYADHEGFRCGTCHPFQPFDIDQDRVLDLWEIPLIVMDGTLKQYRNLTPTEGEERILTLAQRCKAVNGVFTLLWHNSSLQMDWAPWVEMYRRVLPKLAALEGRTELLS